MAKKEYKNAMKIFKSALFFALIVGALVGILVFCFSDFMAEAIMRQKLSAYALRVLAPGLFIVAVMGVMRGFFQGMGTMVPTALSQILEQIVNAIVSIIGASYLLEMGKKAAESQTEPSLPLAYGAAGGTLGTVSGALFGLIFLSFVMCLYYPRMKRRTRRDKTIYLESYPEIYRILFLTITPVILSTAIYNISELLDQAAFSQIMEAQGHAEQEIRSLAGMFTGKYNTLMNIPLAIANALGAALIPSLTATVTNGTKKQINEKINMVIRFVMLIAIPCAVGFLVMAAPILDLLYSGNIAIPARMLQLGAITVIFYCLSTVTNAILQAVNRMSAPVKHGAISLVIHMAALFVMLIVCKWGVYALIAGNIVFSLCMCVLNSIELRRATMYRQEIDRTFILPAGAASIMGLAAYGANYLIGKIAPQSVTTILAVLIAVIIYAVALLKLGALTPEEIVALPKGEKLYRICRKMHLIETLKESTDESIKRSDEDVFEDSTEEL